MVFIDRIDFLGREDAFCRSKNCFCPLLILRYPSESPDVLFVLLGCWVFFQHVLRVSCGGLRMYQSVCLSLLEMTSTENLTLIMPYPIRDCFVQCIMVWREFRLHLMPLIYPSGLTSSKGSLISSVIY